MLLLFNQGRQSVVRSLDCTLREKYDIWLTSFALLLIAHLFQAQLSIDVMQPVWRLAR
jgi:hypothetical protein